MEQQIPVAHIVAFGIDVIPAVPECLLRIETMEHGEFATNALDWPDLLQFSVGFLSAAKALASMTPGVSFEDFAAAMAKALIEADEKLEEIQ